MDPSIQTESDLSIDLVGLSLGSQDPRRHTANCGTHRVIYGYNMSSVNII